MTGKLEPCPLCGGEADTAERYDGIWTAFCTRCGCETGIPASCNGLDEAEAAAFWNTRSDYAVQSANDGKVAGARIAALNAEITELNAENKRLRAGLEAVVGTVEVDMPEIAIGWDGATDAVRREWCQGLYERAAKQDARIAELESLARDMESYIEEFAAFDYHTKEKAMFRHIAITERMAELGIEVG